MLRDLRDGWSEFRSHTWLWAISLQFGVVLMAWYGAFQILGGLLQLALTGQNLSGQKLQPHICRGLFRQSAGQ